MSIKSDLPIYIDLSIDKSITILNDWLLWELMRSSWLSSVTSFRLLTKLVAYRLTVYMKIELVTSKFLVFPRRTIVFSSVMSAYV